MNPFYATARKAPHGGRPYQKDKKVYLRDSVDDAHEFYKKEFELIKDKWARVRSEKGLKYFPYLKKFYEGWSLKEIAFAMKMSKGIVQSSIRQAESRVETYLKIKEGCYDE